MSDYSAPLTLLLQFLIVMFIQELIFAYFKNSSKLAFPSTIGLSSIVTFFALHGGSGKIDGDLLWPMCAFGVFLAVISEYVRIKLFSEKSNLQNKELL